MTTPFRGPPRSSITRRFPESEAIILPLDGPAKYNFQAMGLPENEIPGYQRKRGNQMRNIVREALHGFSGHLTFQIEEWSHVYRDERFHFWFTTLRNLFQTDREFHRAITEATTESLASLARQPKWSEHQRLPNSIEIAVSYVLEELSYFMLRGAEKSAMVIYHRPWPVLEQLIAGTFYLPVFNTISFKLLSVEERQNGIEHVVAVPPTESLQERIEKR